VSPTFIRVKLSTVKTYKLPIELHIELAKLPSQLQDRHLEGVDLEEREREHRKKVVVEEEERTTSNEFERLSQFT